MSTLIIVGDIRSQKKVWQTLNATVMRKHAMSCSKVDISVRVELMESSQMGRQRRSLATVTPRAGPTVGSESMSGLRASALEDQRALTTAAPRKKSRQTSIVRSPGDGRVQLMSKSEGECIIRAEVEAMVARGDTLDRFEDPYVKASLLMRHPALAKFIPGDRKTVFTKYVVETDTYSLLEIVSLFGFVPGLLSVALDSVTVNKRSHILYTVAKGPLAMFWTKADLGVVAHASEAEIEHAFTTCKQIMKAFGTSISEIATDNAASAVAKGVLEKLNDEGQRVLKSRDACHCIDLCVKDLTKTKFVKGEFIWGAAISALLLRSNFASSPSLLSCPRRNEGSL